MKSKSNHHKPSIFLYFIIILAFISVFSYEFANLYYIYGAKGIDLATPLKFFFIAILVISFIYFTIHYHMKDSDLIKANLHNIIYFLSIGILFVISLIYNPKSLIVVILVSLLTFSGLGFIILYLIQHRKGDKNYGEILKTKKVLINICLIIFFWIPTYLSIIFISYSDMNTGIILSILGLGYFLYQKHDKLTLNRKFLGFLLIFVVVFSAIPFINYRIFVRKNIEYKEIYNVEKTIPNSYISAMESFNYTYHYNWSTYIFEPTSAGGLFLALLPSNRSWYQNHIDSLRHPLFIPNSNFKSKFLYNLSAVSIKIPLNISYRTLETLDKFYAEETDINVSSSSSIFYQSPYFSHSQFNIWQSYIFLNHSYFMNPTNVSQYKEINNGYIIQIEIKYTETNPLSNQDRNQYQLVILDEYGNMILVIIYNYFTIIPI